MMMNTLRSMVVLGMVVGSVNAQVLDPAAVCLNTYAQNISNCTENFGPSGITPDPNAHTTCTETASVGLLACLNGADAEDLASAWSEYLAELGECMEILDPVERAGCVSGATILYKWRLDNPPEPNDDCVGEISPTAVAKIESLKSNTTANGFLKLESGLGITISAGISTQPSGEYNVREMACLKDALLVAVYQTKEGGVARVVDADIDLSDGVSFDYFADTALLVDASDVMFVVLYQNQSGLPEFVEFAMMEIEDSPVSGDWNRDLLKDAVDVIDYLNGYNAQVQRSDLSGDGVIDSQDAIDFISEYIQD